VLASAPDQAADLSTITAPPSTITASRE
jgi:hypothetical protein